MDKLAQYQSIVQGLLLEYAKIKPAYGEFDVEVSFDTERQVLSPGVDNEQRDRETKLKLYSSRGVQDYWILNWHLKQVEIYRRQLGRLQLVGVLFPGDILTSPLLPGFACDVERLFL